MQNNRIITSITFFSRSIFVVSEDNCITPLIITVFPANIKSGIPLVMKRIIPVDINVVGA